MEYKKSTLLAMLLFLVVLAIGFTPGCLRAQGSCCFDDTIGVDYLYWTPCINDMDYAIEADGNIENTSTENFKTKYICNDWDSGFRVYGTLNDILCGFNGSIIYTCFDADAKSSVVASPINTSTIDSIKLSTAIPDTNGFNVFGEEAFGKWEIEYQTLDAILSYPLQLTCNRSLEVEAFSGLKWLSFCQERHDGIAEFAGDDLRTVTIWRELEFCGIGPVFGMNSNYEVCDCLRAFGTMATSLLVGSSENKDRFLIEVEAAEETFVDQTYKSHDDCFCFPGLHLMAGVSYDTCYCDMEMSFRLGWEYVHWFNAPTFPFYERDRNGDTSDTSTNSLTFQGIFAGLNISF